MTKGGQETTVWANFIFLAQLYSTLRITIQNSKNFFQSFRPSINNHARKINVFYQLYHINTKAARQGRLHFRHKLFSLFLSLSPQSQTHAPPHPLLDPAVIKFNKINNIIILPYFYKFLYYLHKFLVFIFKLSG
jgi:hypothetical protein